MHTNGNIKSLTLKNFQTFKCTTINFSSSLNFIIGPNGSGKSTISNAISLIFGGTPKTIGKAKNIKEYIRFGEHECMVEAEVYYNNEILKVGRSISIVNSFWYINNELVKKNDYEMCINRMNINVNNLCQYLPQERVSEFCRLSNEELLYNTMLSLDKSCLIQDIKYIIEIEDKLKELRFKEKTVDKQKNELEILVDRIDKDVKRIEEKEMKMHKIAMLESKKIYIEYDAIVKDYKRIEQSTNILCKNYEDNNKEIEVIKSEIVNVENNPLNKDLQEKLNCLNTYDNKLLTCINKLKELKVEKNLLDVDEENLQNTKSKRIESLNSLRNDVIESRNELDSLKDKILGDSEYFEHENLQEYKDNDTKRAKLANTTLDFIYQATDINNLLVKYDSTTINELEDEMFRNKKKINDIEQKCIEIKREVDVLEEEKRKINEAKERRLEQLKKYSYETYKATMWLRENNGLVSTTVGCGNFSDKVGIRSDNNMNCVYGKDKHNDDQITHGNSNERSADAKVRINNDKNANHIDNGMNVKFKNEIIEPPFLNINITDERYINEVETFLSYHVLTSFICKNSDDFELFCKMLKDNKKLSINVVEEPKKINASTYTKSQIQKMGFDGVILDFIDAREEVINYLVVSSHLNEIPVSKNEVNERKIFENTTLKRIAVNNKYVEIRRSKYDSSDFVISSNMIKPKNIFSSKLDISEIDNKLTKYNDMRKRCKEDLHKIYKTNDKIEEKIKVLNEHKKKYDNKITEIKTRISLYRLTLDGIRNKNIQIKQFEECTDVKYKERDINKTRSSIKENIKKTYLEITKILKDMTYIHEVQEAVTIYKLIKNEFNKLQLLLSSKNNLERQNEIVNSTIKEHKRIKQDLKEKIKEKKDLLKDKDYTKEEMDLLPVTLEEINKDIRCEKAKVQFITVDEKVKKDYKTNKEALVELVTSYDDILRNKTEYETSIKDKIEKSIMEIEEEVNKISNVFTKLLQKIGCDGKVEFEYKDLCCRQWKINIYVKFRETEKLEKLCSYRQSGGEKSVSTILYLLALQSIDKAPFRLVDEINQGMDKYNEKHVLDILFDLCENEKNTQFFIISPKLVEGLKYNKSMKVIVLFSDQGAEVSKAFRRIE